MGYVIVRGVLLPAPSDMGKHWVANKGARKTCVYFFSSRGIWQNSSNWTPWDENMFVENLQMTYNW